MGNNLEKLVLADCFSGMLYGCELKPSTRRHSQAGCVSYRYVCLICCTARRKTIYYQPGRPHSANQDGWLLACAHSLLSCARLIPANNSGWRAESAMSGLWLKMYQPSSTTVRRWDCCFNPAAQQICFGGATDHLDVGDLTPLLVNVLFLAQYDFSYMQVALGSVQWLSPEAFAPGFITFGVRARLRHKHAKITPSRISKEGKCGAFRVSNLVTRAQKTKRARK